MSLAAIIVAGGSSTRMGVDKLWADLEGRPLLAWSIGAFAVSGVVDAIIVVAGPASAERVGRLLADLGITARVALGGERRRDSVRAGLDAVGSCEWTVIHDGARPFVTPELIRDGLEAARTSGAAIAAVPVTDTIKAVRDGVIVSTPERSALWAAQTPQVFRTALLREAHEQVAGDATDDAAIVEALGVEVRVYLGAYGNMKITFPDDLEIARTLARRRTARAGHGESHDGPGRMYGVQNG